MEYGVRWEHLGDGYAPPFVPDLLEPAPPKITLLFCHGASVDNYVTPFTAGSRRGGEKYHRDGRRYLAASKSPMSLKDAKAKGYTACEVCRPPEQCFPQHGAEALPRLQSLPALALVAVFKG
jgi:hypothetical protein